ncbi:nuclear transport factor 2 family protein [Oceanobacillus luteolus]|uniref:Nuclear transport factor 2 family protein n=1 Tax=Oceanobacillus luteolus TaxID=1274358 RepID=A0ABW4HUU3_9BACI|nr:nuclear transport factor 2 family protein [Oceanobacillus luteolus]MCM3741961.1 nuclear transport factor 2 family protein [Oceanobacillus luteolus]
MILENYITCLNNSDFEGIASLFTEDCQFNDGGARTINVDDLVVEGREALKQAFQSVWENNKVRAEIVKVNANSMEYNVYLGDIKLECVGCATLKDGLISEYIVRPR